MHSAAGPQLRRLTEPRKDPPAISQARPLTVKEAAERARVSVKTIRRAYSAGHLPFYRPRGLQMILILDVDLDAWALQPGAPTQPPPTLTATSTVRRPRRETARNGDPRCPHEPGSREDLRSIESSVK